MDYKNPRLIRDKENKKNRLFKFVGWLMAIAVIGLLYLLFFSPVFKIQSLEINGLEKIKPENINKIIDEYRYDKSWLVFSHNNFWSFQKSEIKTKIYNHYYFEEFEIKKKWPNEIIINLKEKKSAINWLTKNLCYHLDLTGLAIEYCEESNGYLTIRDLHDQGLEVGEVALSAKDLDYIRDMFAQLNVVVGEALHLINIEKQDNLLTITSEEGIELRLNSNLTVQEQITRLRTLLSQPEVKGNLTNLKYIDLRFGEKIYYQ
ncbi:FtsQ-type POTRA domain-containing protein [Candidatus Falkowbacteria bacterium]|nr:FtsQ-type POTRA domain-containing protein [Candidatus Falkowbacteria bacterium]